MLPVGFDTADEHRLLNQRNIYRPNCRVAREKSLLKFKSSEEIVEWHSKLLPHKI